MLNQEEREELVKILLESKQVVMSEYSDIINSEEIGRKR